METKFFRNKSLSVSFYPSQIPYRLMQKWIKASVVRSYTLNTSPTCLSTDNDISIPDQHVLVRHVVHLYTMYIHWNTVRKLLIFRSTPKECVWFWSIWFLNLHSNDLYKNRRNTGILTSCSSFGFVNMKSKTLSIFAIFIAARFRKNPPLMVSNGFDLALAFRSSSGSSLSNTLCSSKLNITHWMSPQINTYTNRCTYNNKFILCMCNTKIFKNNILY